MSLNKLHSEFTGVDLKSGFATPPGYPAGFAEKILSGGLDEKNRKGTRTRLLRMEPGVYSTEPFVHEYWEEVYLLQGDLIVGNDRQGRGGEKFTGPTYACRPPGVHHGPFRSEGGCLLLEIHYFDES
ncbi:MAG: cupin [Betaproteobacteria bacterium]|nr:cupin [Betaproteobacteria bacterium]